MQAIDELARMCYTLFRSWGKNTHLSIGVPPHGLIKLLLLVFVGFCHAVLSGPQMDQRRYCGEAELGQSEAPLPAFLWVNDKIKERIAFYDRQ